MMRNYCYRTNIAGGRATAVIMLSYYTGFSTAAGF